MSDMEDRNQRLDAAWMQSMMSDFEVKLRPEHQMQADFRIARAAEYAAFQLGRIRVTLESINVSLAKIADK
jgi:hypothetical protein